jgi:hypothetical protein
MTTDQNKDAWRGYANDFNNLTDEQVDQITREEEEKLETAETWLEAVASWEAAGRPRDIKD